MLLRETWLPDIAIIQTIIAPRKGLSVTIIFNCMITVPWKSSFQVAGHSPHFFCFGHAECKLYVITKPYSNHVPTCCQQNYFCCSFLGSKLLQGWSRKDGSEDQILPYFGSTLTDAPKAFQNCDWVLAFIFEINIFNRCLRRPIQWRSGGQETGTKTRISKWLWETIFVWQRSLSQWSGMVYHILSIIIQPPNDIFP